MRTLFIFAISAMLGVLQPDRYVNPVIHMDYSDPDVCRVGEDYYMTSSSFNCFPGLQILHSRDLVNWKVIGAALEDYPGYDDGDWRNTVRHGEGVWAPAIRYHDGWFYIFCGDPDRGVFMVRSQDPSGPWEAPVWLVREKGFIDPCPLWDDDGGAWLSHALAGSRAGLKSVVLVAPMSPDGTHLLGRSRIVFDGHYTQPTIEGTKFYKRDGLYYIFAPAGGVATGWQTVLRSASPLGPYEDKVVMAWSEGTVNGPHQGAWVDSPDGSSDWFIHFQDKGPYGRIVHLQPMAWKDGWPVIGDDSDGDCVGAPVQGGRYPLQACAGDDTPVYEPYGISPEWQYPAVPSPLWHASIGGGIRLYSVMQADGWRNLSDSPNVLQQKFPSESFTVTARLVFRPNPQLSSRGEYGGFAVMGNDYAALRAVDTQEGIVLQLVTCHGALKGGSETVTRLASLSALAASVDNRYGSGNVPAVKYRDASEAEFLVRLEVRPRYVEGDSPEAVCTLSYSLDGKHFKPALSDFLAREGQWIGAKFGFFCNRTAPSNDSGWLDVKELRF